MSRSDDLKREKKDRERADEDLFMTILTEKAPKGDPIGRPVGFKKAYPKLFKTMLDSAIEFNTRKKGI
tara:strand:- start:8066 stop:8269 length:204 start_codon:yes stop_codon:yes gene_type:complete